MMNNKKYSNVLICHHRNTAAVRQGGDRVSVAVTTNSAAYPVTSSQGGAYPTPTPPQTHAPQYSLAYRHPASAALTPQQPPSYPATVPQGGAYPTPPLLQPRRL